MSSKDTHLIPSDLALAVWSLMMLVNRQTPSCCFVAHLQSHKFVIFNSSHMQSATQQVHLDSLTYSQLLLPAPSLVRNLTRSRLELCKTSVMWALNSSSDYKCGRLIFYCENMQ